MQVRNVKHKNVAVPSCNCRVPGELVPFHRRLSSCLFPSILGELGYVSVCIQAQQSMRWLRVEAKCANRDFFPGSFTIIQSNVIAVLIVCNDFLTDMAWKLLYASFCALFNTIHTSIRFHSKVDF